MLLLLVLQTFESPFERDTHTYIHTHWFMAKTLFTKTQSQFSLWAVCAVRERESVRE